MRINMQMIATMLRDESPVVDISSNCPNNLFGAGFTASTGRVCVSKEGDDVLCYSNEDKILLKNCSFIYAFERVQHIFDYYNEWYDASSQLCREFSWQKLIDNMATLFPNPLVMFDINNKVIAMSGRFEKGSVDEEWDFLMDYGVASDAGIKAGRANPRFLESLYAGPSLFITTPQSSNEHEYLTICIKHNDEPWGFLSSVSAVNRFSKGEIDSLIALGKIIEDYIPNKVDNSPNVETNVFKEFLTDRDSNNYAAITYMLNTYGWNVNDSFKVVSTYFHGDDSYADLHKMYISALNSLSIPTLNFDNSLVFILNADCPLYSQTLSKLSYLCEVFNASLISSLVTKDIKNIYFCYEQICFIKENTAFELRKSYDFHDYAIRFMVCTSDKQSLLHACCGDILMLYREGAKGMELANTLHAYLNNERSLQKTAAELNIHKNTISYRIQKALEATSLDLDNPYERKYILFSFAVINTLGY